MSVTLTFTCSIIFKVNLSDNAGLKEARLSEIESELARSHAACTRLSQVVSMLCFNAVVFQLGLTMDRIESYPILSAYSYIISAKMIAIIDRILIVINSTPAKLVNSKWVLLPN